MAAKDIALAALCLSISKLGATEIQAFMESMDASCRRAKLVDSDQKMVNLNYPFRESVIPLIIVQNGERLLKNNVPALTISGFDEDSYALSSSCILKRRDKAVTLRFIVTGPLSSDIEVYLTTAGIKPEETSLYGEILVVNTSDETLLENLLELTVSQLANEISFPVSHNEVVLRPAVMSGSDIVATETVPTFCYKYLGNITLVYPQHEDHKVTKFRTHITKKCRQHCCNAADGSRLPMREIIRKAALSNKVLVQIAKPTLEMPCNFGLQLPELMPDQEVKTDQSGLACIGTRIGILRGGQDSSELEFQLVKTPPSLDRENMPGIPGTSTQKKLPKKKVEEIATEHKGEPSKYGAKRTLVYSAEESQLMNTYQEVLENNINPFPDPQFSLQSVINTPAAPDSNPKSGVKSLFFQPVSKDPKKGEVVIPGNEPVSMGQASLDSIPFRNNLSQIFSSTMKSKPTDSSASPSLREKSLYTTPKTHPVHDIDGEENDDEEEEEEEYDEETLNQIKLWYDKMEENTKKLSQQLSVNEGEYKKLKAELLEQNQALQKFSKLAAKTPKKAAETIIIDQPAKDPVDPAKQGDDLIELNNDEGETKEGELDSTPGSRSESPAVSLASNHVQQTEPVPAAPAGPQ